MKTTCLIKPLEDKSIVWFAAPNQYVIVEKAAAAIMAKIHNKTPLKNIVKGLKNEMVISSKEAQQLAEDLQDFYLEKSHKLSAKNTKDYKDINIANAFKYVKYYKINELVIKVAYESELELELLHLKFAHLELNKSAKATHTFSVFKKYGELLLYVNNCFIGAWKSDETHYFQGKFSMELVQALYQKKESEWLGVFHASAVAKNEKCMLFLGDSGNGKSTSLALLQAHGFECIADDFVPVDAELQQVYKFPAAISIKRNSLAVLSPFYPELEQSEEFHLKQLEKHVRYLPPIQQRSSMHRPCEGFVFIKYDAKAAFSCAQISNVKAFEKIIPDSWLSPLAENAAAFLDWCSERPCYELIYNDTSEMISEVNKLFNNDL